MSMYFNGNNSYAVIPTSLTSGKNIFSFRIKLRTTQSISNSDRYQNPTAMGFDTGGYGSNDISIRLTGGKPQLYCGLASGDTFIEDSNAINDGLDHILTCTCDGGTTYLYVDGVQIGSITGLWKSLTSNPFYIAAAGVGVGYANITVKEAAIWDKCLSASEVLEDTSDLPTNLLAWYKKDSGNNGDYLTTLTDYSGNGNDGTVNNVQYAPLNPMMVFITYSASTSFDDSGNFDTKRIIQASQILNFDTARKTNYFNNNFDTARIIINKEKNNYDSLRKLVDNEILNFDTARNTGKINYNFDTLRKLVYKNKYNFDTLRKIKANFIYNFDTKRLLTQEAIAQHLNFDTLRILKTTQILNFDAKRAVSLNENLNFDTVRKIIINSKENFDTKRKINSSFIYNFDTKRKITTINYSVFNFDTKRILQAKQILNFDTARNLGKEILNFDTKRTLLEDVIYNFDTKRNVGIKELLNFDTRRNITNLEIHNFDTSRKNVNLDILNFDTSRRLSYYVTETENISPIEINIMISDNILADSFSIHTADLSLGIDDSIDGNIKDFYYHFLVENKQMKENAKTQKLIGRYDIDNVFYTPYLMYIQEGATVELDIMSWKRFFGKDLKCYFDSFRYGTKVNGMMTFYDAINQLFSWSRRVPSMQINVFLRNNAIYVLQRGHELQTINIDNVDKSIPDISEEKVRTIWNYDSVNDNGGAQSIDTTVDVFTGEISFDDCIRYYVQGLLMTETKGKESTEYTYSSYDGVNKYIESKTMTSDTQTVVTEYDYLPTSDAKDIYLYRETETTTTLSSGSKSEKVTLHYPIGKGWYGHRQYQDDVFIGSTISQGKPGNKITPYTANEADASLGTTQSKQNKPSNNRSWYIIGQNGFPFPKWDYADLNRVNKEYAWLNKSIKQTISMTLYKMEHVIDFTDLIEYEGHNYYLVSNNIVKTVNQLVQNVTMVRWYKP